MLCGEDFRGREHGDLIAVLDRDDGGLGGHQRFAAAHVALKQDGSWDAGPACLRAISFETRFCAPVGLNGSMRLDLFANAIVQLERDPRLQRAPCCASATARTRAKRTLQRSAATAPACGTRSAGGDRRLAAGKWSAWMAVQRSGSLSRSRIACGQGIVERLERSENAVDQDRAKHSRGDLPGGFVDRHDAAGVQAGFAARIRPRKGFRIQGA